MDNQKSLGDSQAIFLSLYFIGKKQIIANFKQVFKVVNSLLCFKRIRIKIKESKGSGYE